MPTFWIILSSLLFATMSLLVKLASSDFSLPEIVFFRAMPGAVLLLGYAAARGMPLRTLHWRMHIIRNVTGITSMTLGFFALSRLSLATATCLEYTAPLFMMVYVIAARHRPTLVEVLALAGGFSGVLMLLRPSLDQEQLVAFLAGLAAGALAPVAYLQIRRLARAGEDTWRTVLFYMLAAMTLSFVAMTFGTRSIYSLRGVFILLGIGITGLVAQLALTRAYSLGKPTVVATLQFTTIGFAVVYGFLLWGDRLPLLSAAGLAAVCVSGIAAARRPVPAINSDGTIVAGTSTTEAAKVRAEAETR
jgi:S-adenosylmethionine uptake transporter